MREGKGDERMRRSWKERGERGRGGGRKKEGEGAISVGFEGGQTPLYLQVPKKGFRNNLERRMNRSG